MSQRLLQEQIYRLATALENLGQNIEQLAAGMQLMHDRLAELEKQAEPEKIDLSAFEQLWKDNLIDKEAALDVLYPLGSESEGLATGADDESRETSEARD